MLNKLWFTFFIAAFLSALYQWFLLGNAEIFQQLVTALFDMAKLGFEISIGLIGVLALWLGFFKIAEKAGVIAWLARGLTPLLKRLMPGVPENHPAFGSITMNLGANLLGLDNAATPMGLKAMQDLQSLNPEKERATDAQILFLVLNTSSVTLIPVTIFMYRAQMGAAQPTEVFIPILLATSASTFAGLLAVAFVQKIRLWHPVVMAYLGGAVMLLSTLIYFLSGLESQDMQAASNLMANLILFSTIIAFLLAAQMKGVAVYDGFIEGAKEGFQVGVQLIPYLIAMLVAIGVLRASGLFDLIIGAVSSFVRSLGLDDQFVAALPTALMKPFSGSGARGMMLEAMEAYGVDSLVGRMVSVMQGSTETTFYVLAVYFGSVGIRIVRHAVWCGLIADLAGVCAAILICYWFF